MALPRTAVSPSGHEYARLVLYASKMPPAIIEIARFRVIVRGNKCAQHCQRARRIATLRARLSWPRISAKYDIIIVNTASAYRVSIVSRWWRRRPGAYY